MARLIKLLTRLAKRVLGFAASTVILTILSLIAIPAMIEASGIEAWGYIALGQGIGTLFSAFVLWDWGVVGPTRIALASNADRRAEFQLSMLARIPLLVICLPVMFALSICIRHSQLIEIFVGMAFSASIGLSTVWYFAGVQAPGVFLAFEIGPRALGTLLSIVLMTKFGIHAWQGVCIQICGVLVGVSIASVWISHAYKADYSRIQSYNISFVTRMLWNRRSGLSRTMMYNGFLAAPIAIVGSFAPAVLAEFAIYDRIVRQITGATQPLIAALQGLLPHYAQTRQRTRLITFACVIVAALLAVAFQPFVGLLVNYFSAQTLTGSATEFWLVSIIIGAGVLDLILAISIMPILGIVQDSVRVTFLSIICGVPAILAGATYYGVIGALIGLLAGLIVRDVLQLVFIGIRLSDPKEFQ